jgi:hypothetical protein
MPSAFAYLALPTHTHPGDHEEAIAAARRELAAFAAREGYPLAGVFTDVRGRTEAGLYGMLAAIRCGGAVAVVVPDLGHLRHVGCLAGADLRTASRYLRARLLPLAPDPAPDVPTGPAAAPFPGLDRPELGRRDRGGEGAVSVNRRANLGAMTTGAGR